MAALALGRIKDPHAIDPLIAALQDKDSAVRGTAAQGLGEIQDGRAWKPLNAALNDPDSNVREMAAAALKTTPNRVISQLQFTVEGLMVSDGGKFSTDNEGYVTHSTGMSLKSLSLGKLEIPLQSTSVSPEMMIATKDYGDIQIKFNWGQGILLILVTPEQEEIFKGLCSQGKCG